MWPPVSAHNTAPNPPTELEERLHDAMQVYAEAMPSRYDDDDRTPVRSRPLQRIRALPFVSGDAPFVPRRTRRPPSP